MRDTKHVGIHCDAFDDAESFIEHHVGGFASNPGQLLNQRHILRDFASEIADHHPSAFDAVRGFCMVKADGADDLLDFVHVGMS